MDYPTLKFTHQAAVVVSVSGFVARGVGSLLDATWVSSRLAKALPHAVDTVLLLSALALAWMLKLTPSQAPWLLAKLIGLVVYIGFGMVALRAGLPRRVRLLAWLGALVTVAWIISVAISKHPAGFLAGGLS